MMRGRSTLPPQQRSLSVYSLLGALQSALCFLALPSLCKPWWPSVFGGFAQQTSEVLLWWIVAPYFVLYSTLVALPVYLLEWDFFEQFKISNNPLPWKDDDANVRREFWKLTFKTACIDFVNIVLFIPAVVYIKTVLFPERALSFSDDDWPTCWQSFSGAASLALMHEFGFYVSHRLMHAYPSLYRYHKVHHQYKENNVLAAQYNHPVDFLLSIVIPAIVPTIILKPHSFTQFQAGLWIFTANLDDHLGYAFPWSPVRWFPFSAGTDAHEFHHSVNMGSFGSKFSLFDWLFGTDKVYENWRKKRLLDTD